MFKQHQSLVFCVYLAASAAALAQSSYVFQLPGQTGIDNQSNRIVGLGDTDFHRSVTTDHGPSGASQILATPTGAKFYILAPGGIFSANASLSTITPVSAVSGAATAGAITPDGKYLLAITNPNHFYVINTATDVVQVGANTGVPEGGTPIAVAVSHDAKTAWVLSNTATGSTLTALDLGTLTAPGTPLSFTSTASDVVLSPRGLLYVTTATRLYEIDPATLTVTSLGPVTLQGPIGPLQFTPDGNTVYFLNLTVCDTCSPISKLDVPSHSLRNVAPPSDGTSFPLVNQVLVAGNNRVFALSPTPTAGCPLCLSLLDLTATASSLTLGPSTIGSTAISLPLTSIIAAVVSNEQPSARYLYLFITDHNFYRINLATNVIDGNPSSLDPANGEILSFVSIPAQSGASTLLQINDPQTVNPGAVAILTGEILDGVGRPVFGVPATFSDPSGMVAIATPSLVTTSGGWAQTAVTAPMAAGTYTVALNAGSLSATFTLIVSGGGGGGGGGGASQMSIYDGDGQLLKQHDTTKTTGVPLTVLVTDAAGSPLANVAVTFAITQGPADGSVFPASITTDNNGLAATDFTSGTVPQGSVYVLSKVSATSAYGSVVFFETTQDAIFNDHAPPNFDKVIPTNRKLTIAPGGLIPAGISVRTYAERDGQPIPNVGLRLADPTNPTSLSSVVSCQGTSRGDNNGISQCNVLATCQPTGPISTAMVQVGGGTSLAFLVEIDFGPGIPSLLTPVSGGNQTGNPGNSFTLSARVSDGCGQPSSFSGLIWTVLPGSGSAVLSQTQTSSDAGGNVSTKVTFGQTTGSVRVQLSGPGLSPIIFNLTNESLISGISVVSGGGQTAVIGQPFASPVIFIVRDVNNAPVPGLLVNFSTTGSGSASLSPASSTTDAQGHVQTTVTAGASPGDIILTATYKTFTATANLSSHAPGPVITTTSFTNSASGAAGLTPCGLVTVTGSGIAPSFQGTVTGSGFSVGGVSITANNIPAPIQSVSNLNGIQTANFQAPCELTPGSANVVVTVNGNATSVSAVPVFGAQPGIFVLPNTNGKYGWVVRAVDGALVTVSTPARRGEHLYAIVTGLGQVSPVATTNVPGTGSQDVDLSIGVQISGNGVPVPSKRYAAGLLGAYIVEFVVPQDSPVGLDQSLVIAAVLSDNTTLMFSNPIYLPNVIAP